MKPVIGKFVHFTSLVYPESRPMSEEDCCKRDEIAKRREEIAARREELARQKAGDIELAKAAADAIAAEAIPLDKPPEDAKEEEDEEAKAKREAEAKARREEAQAFLAQAMQTIEARTLELEAPIAEEEAKTIEDERAQLLAAQMAVKGKEVVKSAMIVAADLKEEGLPEDDEASWNVDLQIFPGAGRVFSGVPFSAEPKALHWNWPLA